MAGVAHTSLGVSPVALQIAAVSMFACPRMALATSDDGSARAAAIWSALMPRRTPASYPAPETTYCPATSMNGIAPADCAGTYGGASYLPSTLVWAGVGVCSGWYVLPERTFVCSSTGLNSIYGLLYDEATNENVGVLG